MKLMPVTYYLTAIIIERNVSVIKEKFKMYAFLFLVCWRECKLA